MPGSAGAGFLTRPDILGTLGVASASHWIAAQTAMGALERGGNAFDAAASAGFVLQVIEPHLNGPGGDVALLLHHGANREQVAICGQGGAPKAARRERFHALGLDLIPGTGLLPAVVPGAFGAWSELLLRYGSFTLEQALAPAIHYAESGFPVTPRLHTLLGAAEPWFWQHWPNSAALYLSRGLPSPGSRLSNPILAGTFKRLLRECQSDRSSREAQLEAAQRCWYQGFVAAAVDEFCRVAVMDVSGRAHAALLDGDDLAGWRARCETPLGYDFAGHTVLKCGPWSQGPVLLQCLALLDHDLVSASTPDEHNDAELVHHLTEVIKLAFADRERYYGDPDFVDVPLTELLSADYNADRKRLLGDSASDRFRPGELPHAPPPPDFTAACRRAIASGPLANYGVGEPTFAPAPTSTVGDTCFVAVADRYGNLIAATPSGGWLQASPVIPQLGFCLGTRAQSGWLQPGLANSLEPGKRPRTTLTPTLVMRDGEAYLACGTPGGDQQDQWQLSFLVRHLCQGLSPQQAIDAPAFHVEQWPSSFYPRAATPQRLVIEGRFTPAVIDALRERGHNVTVADGWSEGRLGACLRGRDWLSAAANPRGMQGYAVGR